ANIELLFCRFVETEWLVGHKHFGWILFEERRQETERANRGAHRRITVLEVAQLQTEFAIVYREQIQHALVFRLTVVRHDHFEPFCFDKVIYRELFPAYYAGFLPNKPLYRLLLDCCMYQHKYKDRGKRVLFGFGD